jgi:hypothetical protein
MAEKTSEGSPLSPLRNHLSPFVVEESIFQPTRLRGWIIGFFFVSGCFQHFLKIAAASGFEDLATSLPSVYWSYSFKAAHPTIEKKVATAVEWARV